MEAAVAVTLIIAGLVLALLGLLGCVFPVIPGPPLGYFALLLLSYAKNWEPFGTRFLIFMGAVTAVVFVMDYFMPALSAKRYGASRWGVWASILGMIAGVIFFPPFGLFIGGFAGAVAGELFAGKDRDSALKAGMGVFVGNLFAIGIKMGLSGIMLFFYIREMF